MSIYATIIGTIAGICLGYAILYLFIGLRRSEDKRLNLTFSLFAFAYAGTLLMGIWYRSQTTAVSFLAISRWDGIFVGLAFIALNWYVATYTKVGGKHYLWGITAVFTITVLAAILTPTLIYTEMPTLTTIPLPWNEQVANVAGEENMWGMLLLLAQLVTLGFIIFAGIRQWRRGERQPAALLLAGMLWFIFSLLYEILAEVGLWVYIPFAETGFLGIAIVMSLQMANSVIKTEEALAASQKNLEKIITVRTAELAATQTQLIEQAQETAVAAERNRLARDLHDVVTQILFSINLIAISLPRLWPRDPDMAARSTVELQRLTRGALAEMRILLRELRPQTITTTDLNILLTQLCHGLSARHDIPAEVDACENCDLPEGVHVALYRIAQEAMNNIAKHAEATQVWLRLNREETAVFLSIRDNGQGFAIHEVSSQHMGRDLLFMKSRHNTWAWTSYKNAPRKLAHC
ncbi:MAG: hypothetical protein GY796_20720 [Chloroflexi bacterium]|nr:hypothetical protein [Chloroflexota bacterium]